MKKIILFLYLILFLCSLSACSSSTIVGSMESHTSKNVSLKYKSFAGQKIYNLTCKETDQCKLYYYGKLESGKVSVYYINENEKTILFEINSGEIIESNISNLVCGKVQIIIESTEKSKNGEFKFVIE